MVWHGDQVLRALRSCANTGTTALVALLQPGDDVFELFDNVMILTHGEIAFFGSKADAFAHFERLGYRRHPSTNRAEFLQEVVESGTGKCPNNHKYRSEQRDEEEGPDDDDDAFLWLTPDEFVDRYRQSPDHALVLTRIDEIRKQVHDDGTAVRRRSDGAWWVSSDPLHS